MGPASAGAHIMVLDDRTATLAVEPAWLGETPGFWSYTGNSDITGTALILAVDPAPALPLPPVHLQANRDPSGDITLS
ncbi:MAG: hypothetical protein MO846_01205 [Candidatus Devosia symbiotica]|nr:hypothetical protein [Candidatus Devosia symbiotica]